MIIRNVSASFIESPDERYVVATGSIVVDDKEMGKHLHLDEAVWIGGMNVHREFRERGLGTILFACMDKHILQTSSKDTTVCLFANNPGATKIYRQYGLRSQGFFQNNSLKTRDETVGAETHEMNPDNRLFVS